MKYLLDTNILSELVRRCPNPGVLARYQQDWRHCQTAAVIEHEIRYGIARHPSPSRQQALAKAYDRLLGSSGMVILPYDAPAARWHAQERARLETMGQPRAFADSQIAAVAVTGGLILVTRNTTDFMGYSGLHIENWFVEVT
jgi:tRNA(fMet)-specific endonuclease VapC